MAQFEHLQQRALVFIILSLRILRVPRQLPALMTSVGANKTDGIGEKQEGIGEKPARQDAEARQHTKPEDVEELGRRGLQHKALLHVCRKLAASHMSERVRDSARWRAWQRSRHMLQIATPATRWGCEARI